MENETKMTSEARFFNIPEKFLVPETRAGIIQKAITGTKTAFIFRAKQEDQAIGFIRIGRTPFFGEGYCRYSYPKEISFSDACKSGKTRQIDHVYVDPKGRIVARKFIGTEKIFVADDLPYRTEGIKITREEFENTYREIKKMTI